MNRQKHLYIHTTEQAKAYVQIHYQALAKATISPSSYVHIQRIAKTQPIPILKLFHWCVCMSNGKEKME